MLGARARSGTPSGSPSLGRLPVRTVGSRAGPGRRGSGGQYARAVTPEQLQDVVRTAVSGAVDRGVLAVEVPDDVVVERPKNREHGDYATNVALRLAKAAGRPPREVAELLAAELRAQPGIAARRRRRPRLPQHHPRRRARSGRSRSRR